MPIGVVEGFYSPVLFKKGTEISRIRHQVRAYEKQRYTYAREVKNIQV